jgi:hypothetical protein
VPTEAFPLGEARTIEFAMDESTSSRLSHREQVDQVRDWMLFTAVGQLVARPDEISRIMFDRPAIRHGHMRTAQFPIRLRE